MIVALCSKDDFSNNDMIEIVHDNHSYLIAKAEGKYFVLDNMCSHENSELILGCLKNKTIKCSLHGSYFDLETGQPLNEPADEPVKTYKTIIQDNNICIEL
ncbi:MAG: non-heme iron oxygenase ferredoxin subunit [Pseudomonadota bacterium]|nr:non-heme iron oxygenase ferredoxin subunit [Pseudomonadota bacterium]